MMIGAARGVLLVTVLFSLGIRAMADDRLAPFPIRASWRAHLGRKVRVLRHIEPSKRYWQHLLQKDEKLKDFVANPSLKRVEKKAVLEDVLKKQKYSDLTVNLVGAMADNGRIAKIGGVLTAFSQIMSAHRGEVICTVKTAKALDGAAMTELKAALQGFLKKGETLHLATEVDPSLIGGMVVSIGDKYVDMSMATKIKNYTNLIKQAV